MRLSSPIQKKHARIEIIPLIDIMFFLLASFMMVSLNQTHMKGIKVQLPSNQGAPPNTVKDFVSIRVGAGSAYFFDGQYVQPEEVMPRLYAMHKQNPGIKVSISAEPMALHGDVIGVLDKVRTAGISKVGYQIRTTAAGAQPGAAAPQPAPPPPR